MPELARYVPPAETIDKPVYSPSWGPDPSAADSRPLHLVVSGGETDMCVLATALGAVEYLAIAQCSCGRGLQQFGRTPRIRAQPLRQPDGRHVEISTAAEVAELLRQ